MKATVYVTLKASIADPQGTAVKGALIKSGYAGVLDVRIGKLISLELEDMDEEQAKETLREMCEKLLANTVIESFDFTLE